MNDRFCVGFCTVALISALGCTSATTPSSGSHAGTAGKAAKKPVSAGRAGAGADTSQAGAGASNPAPTGNAGASAPRMNECDLHTGYVGDEYCILAPPADKGFQVHIGPSDYANPEAKYILKAGQESTTDFPTVSTNDKKVFFYYREFRMRPGAHHMIISTANQGGGFGMGRRIGTTNNLVEDSPKGGVIAPENKGVGIAIDPATNISVSLHSINTTNKPQLREVWINFYYRNPEEVTEPVQEMFQAGDAMFSIQPHADVILGRYSCQIAGTGRMLWFYGHRHANNVRFSAWRVRGEQRDLFYDAYNWEEALVLEYSSTVTNAAPDPAQVNEGGWSGILDLMPGDKLEWECHVINKTDGVLRFTNNTYTGEMCIMDAELVGANCPFGG